MTYLVGWSRAGGSYIDLVNSYNPILFYPLDENSGTTVNCQVDANQNGTYSNVTLDDDTGPFGEITTVDFPDADEVYVDFYSTTFESALDITTGSIIVWVNFDDNFWDLTTGTNWIVELANSGGEAITIFVDPNNDDITAEIVWTGSNAEEASHFHTFTTPPTGWTMITLTWDQSADESFLYVDETQVSSDTYGITSWGTPTGPDYALGNANTSTTTWQINRNLGYFAVFDTVLDSDARDALVNYPS